MKGWTTLDGVCSICQIEQHDITPSGMKQTKRWKFPDGDFGKNKGCK